MSSPHDNLRFDFRGCDVTVQALECYVCDSATDSHCYAEQPLSASASQQSCLPMNKLDPDQCYTYRHPSNGTVRRGCFADEVASIQLACTADPEACVLCTTAGCNGQTTVLDVCVECDSAEDGNCGRLSNGLSPLLDGVQCPLSVDGQVGCYRYEQDGRHLKP